MGRQNLLKQSQALGTTPWTDDATGVTLTNNYAVAPDGNTTATRLVWASGLTKYVHQSITWTRGVFTFSVWMRATTGTAAVRIRVKDGTTSSSITQTADIPLDTTWRRFQVVSFTNGINTYIGTTGFIVLGIIQDSGGLAGDILVWGAQLEQSNNMGDYVATTTTTVDYGAPMNGRLPQNLLIQSETFDGTAGSIALVNVTCTPNVVTAPDGSLTADKLVETAVNSTHLYVQNIIGLFANTRVTLAVYAKAAERSWLRITEGGSVTAVAFFDLSAGVLGSVSGTGSPSSRMTAIGNGWYRCEMSFTTLATSTAGNFEAGPTTGDTVTSYLGDVTKGIYVWGQQAEQANTAGDYIKTLVVAANRGSPNNKHLIQNLLLQSEELSDTLWSKFDLTVTSNTSIAPDGTMTADRLTDNTNNNVHAISNQNAAPVIVGSVYTLSCFLKYETQRYILMGGNGGDTTAYVYVDLLNGVIASATGTNLINWGIIAVGGGWYRVWNTFVCKTSGGKPTFYWATSVGGITYAGTGTTMLMWGMQYEQASAMGDYVRTLATAVNDGAPANKRLPQNGIAYSNTPGDANWTLTAVTIALNTTDTLAPDKTFTATKLTETNSTTNHRIYISGGAFRSSMTTSVYAKAGTRNWAYLTLNDAPGSIAWFNLATGTVGTVQGGALARITSESNGWYRCEVTVSPTAVSVGFLTNASYGLTSGDAVTGGVGDGTGTIYLWGPQTEYSNGANDYDPVVGAQLANTTYFSPSRIRQPQNLITWSEDFSNAVWNKTTGVTVTGASVDVPPPFTGMGVSKLIYDGSGVAASNRLYQVPGNASLTTNYMTQYTYSVWLRTSSGTRSFLIGANGDLGFGAGNLWYNQITVTTTWQRFWITDVGYTSNRSLIASLYDGVGLNSAFTLYMTGAQWEQSDTAGDYIATTAASVNPTIALPAHRSVT